MPDQPIPVRRGALAPFESNIFRSVWFATLASNMGSLIQGVGAAWMMTSITKSADLVALVQASTTLPIEQQAKTSERMAHVRVLLTQQLSTEFQCLP